MAKTIFKHLVEVKDTAKPRGKGNPNRGLRTPSFDNWSPVEELTSASGISDGDYGDVTISGAGTVINIDANVVTNDKLATMATARIKGRVTAGTGNPEDLTGTQATTLLDAVVGDSGSGGTKGLVPAPAAGDAAANKYLKADGTWSTVSAGVSVSHDALTQGAVTVSSFRLGGTATTISTPAAGEYNLVVQSGAFMQTARIFGNNTVLNGSNEFIVRVNNSANSLDRTFSVQLYDANNGALVDQQATATNHTQTVSGNITVLTFPGMNGFGATGFYIELR